MVLQAAAHHVAAEGSHVGSTHSLHRTTPGLLRIHQAGNNKAAKLPPTYLRKSSFRRRQTVLPVIASPLTDVRQMCTHKHPHGAPTHTTLHGLVPTHALEFPSQGDKTKGWEGPKSCLDVESGQMKSEQFHMNTLRIQIIIHNFFS